ncbi:type II secretion system F family protein [Lactiplantibacillus sp. WILCCON 0030]|uniref:Type II secretion system F family protein n=1 Tax=Lactiplantibacillus brownii TaxID=3069269 RepID=A0ABU1A9X6_9LACO|nr:type II secretion system F family protein [Lactiplantibacillus brownii]MDQ7937678.1 type II secretion system F family protein [Lactiplantibacillus brownii]
MKDSRRWDASLSKLWRGTAVTKRLTIRTQATLFETLADLIDNGFSLRDAMRFIVDIHGQEFKPLTPVMQQLQAGVGLATALQAYIAVDLYYQLLIAEQHGALTTTLKQAGQLMRTKATQQQQIKRLLQYPLVLLALLIGTLVLVKTAILPNFGAAATAPAQVVLWELLLGSVTIVCILGTLIVGGHLKRLPTRERYLWLARVPIVGALIRTYCGYYLTLNAGMLLAGGLELRGICEVSSHFKAQSLLQQQGHFVERSLLAGQSLGKIIKADRLLPDELSLLVGKESPTEQLSQEMIYFAMVQYQRLVRELNRLISWIQPLMFMVIAMVIVGTYLNILLPMYQSMGDILK